MSNNRWSKAKMSKVLEEDKEDKKAKRKAMDEMELKKLNRETRMIKQAKMRDVVMEKQIKVKDLLEKENASLKDNLKPLKSTSRCISDSKQTQEIINLFAQGDDLDDAISQEKKYIEDLESQIHRESKNIQSLKKIRGKKTIINSDYLMDKDREKADRMLESYESKFAAEQKQLAIVIKENEEMRKKLDHLLKEKAKFNQLYEELMGKLTQSKHVLRGVVEQSRLAFQKRDEVYRKIKALKSRNKEDLAKRMDEMRNLQIKFYEDTNNANFRHRVQLIRENLDEKLRPSTETVEQAKLAAMLDRIRELLNQLTDAAGVDKPEEICDHIIKEDENLFSLFNFNNEVRYQVEVVTHDNIQKLKVADEEYAVAESEVDGNVKYKELLTRKLRALQQEHSDLIDLSDDSSRVFSRLLHKIKKLFDTMDCNSSPLQELLGNNAEVTEFNYKLYLGLIETRTIEALDEIQVTVASRSHTMASASMKISSMMKSINSSKCTKSTCNPTSIVSRRVLTKPCGECDRSYKHMI